MIFFQGDSMEQKKNNNIFNILLSVCKGALIGLGAVLPGISGGVLSVIFGIYKPVMELLADPFHKFKTHVPKLIPYFIGGVIGFLGIANLLAFVLEKYPYPSVCLFIGLIGGMIPSLFREANEKGRSKWSPLSLIIAMIIVFALLITLKFLSIEIQPSFGWYIFCGFCLAISIIAPGMSFSTLLMPLGLYTSFVDGIGKLKLSVLIPGGIGGLVTILALSKLVNALFDKHYTVAFHAIIGIVIAATVMIIPFESFTLSVSSCLINILFLVIGVVGALLLDRFNSAHPTEE